jgi:cell division protein FtsB
MLRVRWDRAGRIGLLIVLAVVVGFYVQHALSYLSTKSQFDQQQGIVNRLQHQNTALEREQKSLSDPSTIVKDARALGMVRPGERPYVIIGLGGR